MNPAKTALRGQRVVVMGGGSGIGLATARTLVMAGADVTIAGRTQEKLAAAAASAPGPLRTAEVDASSAEELRKFYAAHGAFHHLVLSLSGAKGAGTLRELDPADLRAGLEAKVLPYVQAAREALPTLAAGGSLTFVTAASARAGLAGTAGLAAINGAIEAMVRPLARELKPLRVNAVSPGVIETPWWDAFPPAQRKAMLDGLATMSLAGRNGRPEEVAAAIVYLVGNGFVTGTVLEVDGGLRAG